MPIAFDNKTQNLITTGTSISISHTTSGTDRLVVAVFLIRNEATAIAGTPTYGGQNMSLAIRRSNAGDGISAEIWYLSNAPSGANTLSATLNDTDATRTIVSSFTDVATTGALDQTAGADSATVNITPTSNNQVLVGGLISEDGTAPTQGSGETLLYGTDEGTWATGGQYAIQTTATTQAFNMGAVTGSESTIIVASFREASPSVSASENITISESVILELTHSSVASDTITSSENIEVEIFADELALSVEDNITVQEAIQVAVSSLQPKVQDTIIITEQLAADILNNFVVLDSITTTELVTIVLPDALEVSTTDSITITDTPILDLQITTNTQDSVIVSESLAGSLSDSLISVIDNISISEALQVELQGHLKIEDEVTVIDTPTVSLQPTITPVLAVDDTITITENNNITLVSHISKSESINVSESIEFEVPIAVIVQDTITVSESMAASLPDALIITVNESIVVTDQPTTYRTLVDFTLAVDDTINTTENLLVGMPYTPDPLPKAVYIDGRLAYLTITANIPHYIYI